MKKAMKVAIGLLLWAVIGFSIYACATAPEVDTSPSGPSVLRNEAGGTIVVWRDSDRMREGFRLINAGAQTANPALMLPLISCIAPDGTEVAVIDGGALSSTVTVITGREAGCRGVVPNERLSRRR